jgi:hypothetical protein
MMLFIAFMSKSDIARHLDSTRTHAKMLFVANKRTHAVHKIKDVQTKIQDYVKKYRQARSAMITLGCSPEDPRFEYPELKDADLYTKNVDHGLCHCGIILEKIGIRDRITMA